VPKLQILSSLLVLFALLLVPAELRADDTQPPPAVDGRASLRTLIEAAKQNAPEVTLARASLVSSRSTLENGRLAPFGNPYLEVTAERGSKNVTQDVALNGTLWLPVELSGQRQSRGREAEDFVSLHTALVEQARARAAARLVRAYGSSLVAAERAAILSELLASARAEATLIGERVKAGDAIARDASLAAVEAARHEVMLAETRAELLRARGELSEVLGRDAPETAPPANPPALVPSDFRGVKLEQTPQSRALSAEARFFTSSAERWRREGQSPLGVMLVAGRGDLGETRLGAGLAYALPAFRTNRPESARAMAESTRALAERRLQQALASRRLQLLALEQEQLSRAIITLTTRALPAAQEAVSAAQETYAAGKTELLAVLLSRRELSALSLRRLELLEQNWFLVSQYVEITGQLP
jgi:outer membrane protein, heavy metal efflux system